MLQPVVFMRGAAAAELFYGGDKFTRNKAMPLSVLMLLQDFGSVQLLDGRQHRHRKVMFRGIASPREAKRLAETFVQEWRQSLSQLAASNRVVLFDALQDMLTRCGAAWAGIPLSDSEARLLTREYSEMLQSSGSVGPRLLRALWLRRRTERWAIDVIKQARSTGTAVPADSALYRIAFHRELDGKPLHDRTAAIELINVLRATVAVAHFIVFAAKALHEHPEPGQRLRSGDEIYLEHFVQEVRRTAPFFPFIGGRVCEPVTWNGYHLDRGAWVVLDLYGTNTDKNTWQDPDRFDPDRFAAMKPSLFDFIPQGGGDADVSHRCPGEAMTVELMKAAVRVLTQDIHFEVPPQDLSVSRATIPALPTSRFIITHIRPVEKRMRAMAGRL
jgi:fatty-acid peroxygenase